jgi:hypothetical protein
MAKANDPAFEYVCFSFKFIYYFCSSFSFFFPALFPISAELILSFLLLPFCFCSKHLSHMFPAVSSQVDVGLYTAKRIPNFLEKMALLTLTYAQDLQKITSHEQGKGDKAQQDQATNHVFGYQKVQHVVGYMSSQLQQFSHRLMTEVIEPLTQLHNESVKKREKIVDRERKYSADIKAAEQEVTQRRIACLKSWRSLQSTQLERDEMENKMRSDPKKKSKFDDLQADLQKQQNKTLIEFKRFEEHLSTVTQQEVAYHTQLMPGLLKELESLEQTRLLAIETYIARFGKLFRDMFEPFEQYCAGLDRDVAQMNAQQTMVAFANGLVSQFGEPPAPTSMLQDLPCDSVTLATADPAKLRELLSGNISNLLESNGVSAASASESMFGQFSSFLGFASERKSSTAVDNKPAVKPPADDDAAAKATNALRNLVIPPEDPQGCDIVRAVFDFDGKEPDDVDFKVHDLIRVLTRPEDSNEENIKNGEWWIGRVLGARALNRRADGKMERVFVDGTFPSNYVEKLTIGPVRQSLILILCVFGMIFQLLYRGRTLCCGICWS